MHSPTVKRAGKFMVRAWTDGHPVSGEIEHTEPNGDLKELRWFGAEELYELKHCVDRMIALLEAGDRAT